MSEHDAHRALTDTARLRLELTDELDATQWMPIADRRRRQAEAREMYDVMWSWRQPFEIRDYPTQAARRGWTDE